MLNICQARVETEWGPYDRPKITFMYDMKVRYYEKGEHAAHNQIFSFLWIKSKSTLLSYAYMFNMQHKLNYSPLRNVGQQSNK